MSKEFTHLLAHEGSWAVEVSMSDGVPLMVVLIGPIKVWWGQLESPEYGEYAAWRDAVRVALIHAGHLVYSPHRAWQGLWQEKAQIINDAAVRAADLVVALTPPGVVAEGTAGEITVAEQAGVPVLLAPPGDDADLADLLRTIRIRHM